MAVSFERYGRLYYLDPDGHAPKVGDRVLVPTDNGTEVAECVWAPAWVDEEIGGLPKLAGLAAEEDVERDTRNRGRRAEAKVAAKRLIREYGLPMKVLGVDYLDRGDPRRMSDVHADTRLPLPDRPGARRRCGARTAPRPRRGRQRLPAA